MKSPLSIQAQTVLNMAKGLRADPDDDWGPMVQPDDVIFVNPMNGKGLAANSLVKRCHQDNLGCTPHGLRSSLAGWAMEHEYPQMVVDMALAHVVGR